MSDGTLYFSSEGWNGLGGLDIFVCPDPAAARPILMNAGYPVNTRNDDFALQFNTTTNKGFVSSNRAAGGFNDDIYALERTGVTIRGVVVRKEDGVVLKNAKVVLDNGNGKTDFTTGADGRFQFRGELKKAYTATASAPWRYDGTKSFNTNEVHPGLPFVLIELDLRLYKAFIQVVDSLTMKPLPGAIIRDAATGQQLGVADADGIFAHTLTPGKAEQLAVEHKGFATRNIELAASPEDMTDDVNLTAHMIRTDEYYLDWTKTVYFDLNKHAIRKDAGTTLDEVVALLKEKRHFKIAITSGCDSRASDAYNDALSRNRSAAVRKYLVSKGVKANQIKKVKWTGEKSLANNCTNDTPCSEEMHQQNRRSDIVVVEIK
jgi:outer membrane protein OmpA-like peptidoglycan-associated protein